MAYIKCQFNAGAKAPVDMPPFLSQVKDVTSDMSASYAWFYIPTGYPVLADDNIVSNFILNNGTSSTIVWGYTHIAFKNELDVSNKSAIEIRAKILHRTASASYPQRFRFRACYQGQVVATSNEINFSTSADEFKVFTASLTGVNKIDEIILDTRCAGHNNNAAVTVQWQIKTADGGYIKFT